MLWQVRRGLIAGRGALDAAPAAPSTATFDAAVRFQATLSPGNLAATNSVGPGNFGDVRGTTSKSTGKFFLRWTMTGTVGGAVFIGLCNATQSFASGFYPGSITNAGVLNAISGILDFNGTTNSYTVASLVSGDVDELAVDVGAGLLWARRNAGNWNNDIIANQNPATGAGGFNFSVLGTPGSTAIYFMAYVQTDAAIGTIDTSGSGAPAGFGPWT